MPTQTMIIQVCPNCKKELHTGRIYELYDRCRECGQMFKVTKDFYLHSWRGYFYKFMWILLLPITIVSSVIMYFYNNRIFDFGTDMLILLIVFIVLLAISATIGSILGSYYYKKAKLAANEVIEKKEGIDRSAKIIISLFVVMVIGIIVSIILFAVGIIHN